MTVTSFASNSLWSCCRRHLVGQLNRPFTQFSESRKDTCRCDLNSSIYRSRSVSCNPQTYSITIIFRLQRRTTWRPLMLS